MVVLRYAASNNDAKSYVEPIFSAALHNGSHYLKPQSSVIVGLVQLLNILIQCWRADVNSLWRFIAPGY